MTAKTTTSVLTEAIDVAKDAGDKVFKSLTDVVGRIERETAGLIERGKSSAGCSCSRPPACWMPRELPPIDSVVCPCGTARVRVTVRNCGLRARQVFIAATGADAGLATGSPSTATIGALESAELVAEVTLPHELETARLILWVRGCHDTAMQWTVTASEKGCDATHEVAIEDCPDTYHDWHDHFAQPRPCSHRRGDDR